MSDLQTIKNQFTAQFDELKTAFSDSFKEVFKQKDDVVVENKILDVGFNQIVGKQEFPQVVCIAEDHHFNLDVKTALQLNAWFSEGDPSDKLDDEQLKVLSDALGKVLKSGASISDLKVDVVESADGFTASDGLVVQYIVKVGKTEFNLYHCIAASTEEVSDGKTSVSPAEFADFGANGTSNGHSQNMDMLLDVDLDVQVELGRKPIKIQDVLKLGKGSVVELDKTAGEPLEVFINKRKLAEGELVVVDDHFGIRITKLVEPRERLSGLQ